MKDAYQGLLHFVPNATHAPSGELHSVVPGPTPVIQLNVDRKPVAQPAWSELKNVLDSSAVRARVAELLKLYPVAQGALLEVLWIAQSELGWVPHEAIRWAARECGCSPAHALGVATFYTMYQHAPAGRFLLQFCQNICCHIAGAEDVISVAERLLGVKANGGTTADGLFTLLRVECLGACGNGPVMLVNDDFATDVQDGRLTMLPNVGLNEERLSRIIEWCRARAAVLPEEPSRDPIGGVVTGSGGHPGAPGAVSAPQVPDYAPAAPALAVKAVAAAQGVTLTWKIAPEVTALQVERLKGTEWIAVGSPGVRDKDFSDSQGVVGDQYRIVATTGSRVAKPSQTVRAASEVPNG